MTQQTAIQTREQQKTVRFNSVRRLIESEGIMAQIQRALPKHITPERMARVAVTALQRNPKLLDCTESSLIRSLIEASELGLEVNTPLGQAFLIPYKTECTLQIGYKGFIQLAHRSGKISHISAEVVYENDHFDVSLGTHRNLLHVPAKGDRGKALGAYAVVTFRDGSADFEYMSADEIGLIKERSPGARQAGSPWTHKDDWREMWRKTPIRRLAKRLPASPEDNNLLTRAAAIDELNSRGFTEPPPTLPTPALVTEEQRIALVNAAKASGAPLSEIVNGQGFAVLADITTEAYDAILDTVTAFTAAPTAPASPSDAPNAEEDAIQGEPVFDEDEAILIDLREAVNGMIADKLGTGNERKVFLKGRVVENLTAEQLEEMLHTLQTI